MCDANLVLDGIIRVQYNEKFVLDFAPPGMCTEIVDYEIF